MSQQGFIILLWGILTWFSSGSKGCGQNQWPCTDGTCIFLIGRCDNLPDCPDESDEKGCVSAVCNEGQRPCSSGECIDAVKFCDGVIHCKDAGDELAADCRGVIISTTKKSTSVEKAQYTYTYAKPHGSTREISMLNTTSIQSTSEPVTATTRSVLNTTSIQPTSEPVTATPRSMLNTTSIQSTSEPVTATPRSIFATTLSPLLISNNTLLTSMQYKTTSVEISTASTEETRSEFVNTFTTKSSVTTTTLEAQHPPSINIPVKKHTNSQTPMKLPTTWFPITTRKTFNVFSLTTPVPKKTTRPSSLHKTTRKYLFNMNNNTFQPTTVKSPCVTTEDHFEFCRRRYRGYFRHPNDCKQYIVCEWGGMHICTCPNRTHWDLHLITCVWEYASPCITGQYDTPVVISEQTAVFTPRTSVAAKFRPPFLTTVTKETRFMTSTPRYEVNEYKLPPARLRVLPATPAWLKELTERSFFKPLVLPAPRYQSLLTRFFKATPAEGSDQNVKATPAEGSDQNVKATLTEGSDQNVRRSKSV